MTNDDDKGLALDQGCANMLSEITTDRDTFDIEENVPGAEFSLGMIINSPCNMGALLSSVRQEDTVALGAVAVLRRAQTLKQPRFRERPITFDGR